MIEQSSIFALALANRRHYYQSRRRCKRWAHTRRCLMFVPFIDGCFFLSCSYYVTYRWLWPPLFCSLSRRSLAGLFLCGWNLCGTRGTAARALYLYGRWLLSVHGEEIGVLSRFIHHRSRTSLSYPKEEQLSKVDKF